MIKLKKFIIENTTYWFIIISLTILCSIGKFNDELYLFIIGIIFGHTISKLKTKSNEKS